MPEVLTRVDPDDSIACRELDVEIARKVMCWPVEPYGLHNGNHDWLSDPVNYPHVEITDDPLPYTGVLLWRNPEANGVYWSPSTSIEAAMEVEDRIAELGLQSAYYRALLDIIATSVKDRVFHHFDLIHATAEQRCRAALKAVG